MRHLVGEDNWKQWEESLPSHDMRPGVPPQIGLNWSQPSTSLCPLTVSSYWPGPVLVKQLGENDTGNFTTV